MLDTGYWIPAIHPILMLDKKNIQDAEKREKRYFGVTVKRREKPGKSTTAPNNCNDIITAFPTPDSSPPKRWRLRTTVFYFLSFYPQGLKFSSSQVLMF